MKKIVAILLCLCALPVLADPIPPPGPFPGPYKFDKTLPEMPSPAAVSVEAPWMDSLSSVKWKEIDGLPPFHCGGAVIRRLEVERSGAGPTYLSLWFRAYIGLRKGDDVDFGMSYDVLDGDHVIGSGKVKTQNLDERVTTPFLTMVKVDKKALAALTAAGGAPIVRITLSVDEQY